MDSDKAKLGEKEKINLAKKAFDGFIKKMDALFKRQNELFEGLLERINERKLDEQRKKIDEAYKNKVEEALKKRDQ
ncbi:MAG: hypothetical protein WC788_01865 [Candidatus Paceibacterota bacterium]|jgi:hypothetical protein